MRKENLLLKEELALAKTPFLYFIFDLGNRNLLLKSRGMILREWKIEKVQWWGGLTPLQAVPLAKKSTLFPPRREKIRPGESDEGEFELEAMELKDMPASYVLVMEGGPVIYIRPKGDDFFSRLGNIRPLLKWYLWIPVKGLWQKARKRGFSALNLRLASPQDAQALYWAMQEGGKSLFYRP